jgi:hypothetical protein
MRKRSAVDHPALALMRHEAKGYLTRFPTDLDVHDAAALAQRPNDAFAWVLHTGATWFGFMCADIRRRDFAQMFVHAYGADECRFFFWDRAVLTRYPSAAALDERIAEYERGLRDEHRRALLADRGIA